ncbi:DUF6479 family protein [Streptomyces mangrovisoli]|uniref:Secreted protein n=1 Tax=Streptomyces mangrovisoli TaxID=1428628 RepID=A0A1J4P4C7_9ACTN|nr:DUF6479 family protein [Streptomyces mangrovisoli]OIJ68317.1 hypothetical protein WN71_007775 [Streptomyces mangrovisoli]
MHTTHEELAAAGSAAGLMIMVGCGLLVTAALVAAVRLGIGVRRKEPAPPRRGDHPTPPPSGPVREEQSMREPNEVPRATGGSDRLTPHQLGNAPSRPDENQTRPRWHGGSSGPIGG